jgi:hypothetical protein
MLIIILTRFTLSHISKVRTKKRKKKENANGVCNVERKCEGI